MEITGLRNPCSQINDFQPGLLKQVLRKDTDGQVRRLTGVMGVVTRSGSVATGDTIIITLPAAPLLPLTTV